MAPASLERAAIWLFVASSIGCCLLVQLGAGQQQTTNQQAKYYELKFQSEIDNSTILKLENQQQIFKCQVRLAPTSSQPGPEGAQATKRQADGRLRTLIVPLQGGQHYLGPANETNPNETNKSPGSNTIWSTTNVSSLRIDWFKDNRPLAADSSGGGELVSIINVELKGNGSGPQPPKTNDKRNKARIEVRNTSNGNQLKLTSRLKIGQLRTSDSGHYKCLARASFYLPTSAAAAGVALAPPGQQLITTPPSQVQLIEQQLESNSAILSVLQSGEQHNITTTNAVGKNIGKQYNDVRHANSSNTSKANTININFNSNTNTNRGYNAHQGEELPGSRGFSAGSPTPLNQTSRQTNSTDDNGTSNGDMRWGSQSSAGQFDTDDEDLAVRQIGPELQQPSNFISGGLTEQVMMRPTTNDYATTSASESDDDDDRGSFRWRAPLPPPPSPSGANNVQEPPRDSAAEEANEININNDSLSASDDQDGQPNQSVRPHDRAPDGPSLGAHKRHPWQANSLARDNHQQQQQWKQHQLSAHHKDPEPSGADQRLGGLAKLVHKIAPELACYTAMGEHYRGNLAQTSDGRHCLSWSQASQHLGRGAKLAGFIFRPEQLDDIHHNHCRNPTMDPRGPWCMVSYEQDLDLAPSPAVSSGFAIQQLTRTILIGGGGGGPNDTGPRYIQRQCSVAPCSEYLWLYIVAPPLGLLIILSCLIGLLVRHVRGNYLKSHYLGPSRRSRSFGRFGLRKLLLTNGGKFAPKKFSSSSSCSRSKNSSCGRYLDDDIFEIVDDIDWSDGTNQSPRSQESLKLSAATTTTTTTSGDDSDSQQRLNKLKANSGKGKLETPNGLFGRQPRMRSNEGSPLSPAQVGPVFATLRCQARSNLKTATTAASQVHGNTLSRLNSNPATFVDANRLKGTNNGELLGKRFNNNSTNGSGSNTSSLSPKASSSLSSPSADCRGSNPIGGQQLAANSGHLISCSTTTEDMAESSLDYCYRERYTSACDLPLISPESISIANNQQQPLYEGKFSQVQLAFVRRQPTVAGARKDETIRQELASSRSNMDIGAQVALCALKTSANLDELIFEASNLKLHNLNHLNILKLIGYSTHAENEIGLRQSHCCSLIYDMGQLVDLNDWLRQQNKDIMISCEPGGELGTRRNLTCFAKQIALALDYLHDKGIVYKDLACRNCFLDPTKMLVKLASFNLEFVSSFGGTNCENDQQQLNSLRSMIRPKYLLDYYVIDSRPSDSQLLPLSWIPLESILFNKFNMQTDVWSFGCLLYELFSLGEVAYFGYSSKQVIDAVRSNLMPPQPLLCPNGIYKLMCKCLSDIPSMRPNVKQIYEQLNLYSGQCSSFLDHHLCSLAANATDEQQHLLGQSSVNHQMIVSTSFKSSGSTNNSGQGSISKTKSYANIRNFIAPANPRTYELDATNQDRSNGKSCGPEVTKIPLSKSINLGSSRLNMIGSQAGGLVTEMNHYDEPVVGSKE